MNLTPFILSLHSIQAIKFGSYPLKSGVISPIYVDLRIIISYPKIFKELTHLIWQKIQHLKFDFLCGVPYSAIPFATAVSLMQEIPMVIKRKERKEYGTKKIVEGVFKTGSTCLVIEDVMTSAQSLLETIEALTEEGLIVKDIFVVIDRQQGGKEKLKSRGVQGHSLITLPEIMQILLDEKKIDLGTHKMVMDFLCG
ncbi:MAG: orotate phosphoribosyltransferase [Chlamydiae bacterium]|nr:orotate phosphoribosyltransferase [Chlamydiota bacterium]